MTDLGAIVVTGGSNGIGYFISEQLAQAGRKVIIAARNPEAADRAIAAIRVKTPDAMLDFQQLDLGSLASITRAAAQLSDAGPLAAVIANAGVVHGHNSPSTHDGFELFFGTNHLGHFALLAQLFPALRATPGARIVHLGSLSHLGARPITGVPERRDWFSNYISSKLAVMQFGFELDRRLRRREIDLLSVVAHPGNAPSAYTPDRPGLTLSAPMNPILKVLAGPFSQGKDAGAKLAVHAATAAEVTGGSLWGPSRFFGMSGDPAEAKAAPWAYDRTAASRLWELSARLSTVDFEL